jgi:hypothetical protein
VYSKTNSGISKLKSQKQLYGPNWESERTLFMKSKLMHTGSFDNCPPKNFLYNERDSLTEQREARRNAKMTNLTDREGSLKNSSRRISGNLMSPRTQKGDQMAEEKWKAPLDKNSDSYSKKMIKKNKGKGTNSRHFRKMSKMNMLPATDSCLNLASHRSSRSKKLSKSNGRKEMKAKIIKNTNSYKDSFPYEASRTIDADKQETLLSRHLNKEKGAKLLKNSNKIDPSEIKENLMVNEVSSKRYSEVMFKDNVFDSRDDSTSGINELNLLQELSNFTNMKMGKKGKTKQLIKFY